MLVSGKHEIYCCGSRVRISEKGVEVLTEPKVEYCPLHSALYGTEQINREAVRDSVEKKIKGQGFCCKSRVFSAAPIVAYGASEMMQSWLEQGLIDCCVVVCEGTGTVLASDSKLVQAIGARLTGIIRTSPIKGIIEQIEANGGTILNRDARIDQFSGVKRAFALGFRNVAVSVAGFQSKEISRIRKLESHARKDVLIFSVCNTGVEAADMQHIANADIVCASASMIVRKSIGSRALLQLGITIPVYALTQRGKRFILSYLKEFAEKLVVFKTHQMPYEIMEKGPQLKESQCDQKA